MSQMIKSIVLGVAALVLFAGAALAHQAIPQFAGIDAAEDAGLLDAEQALLYKFYYVFDPAKLPADYRPADGTPIKCVTPLIASFEANSSSFAPATVQSIEGFLAEPAGDKLTYLSPGGRFRLTYLTSGANGVSPTDVNPANGVPDFVERCAEYMDTSWDIEITTLGFDPPPIVGYYEISFENMGAYGYTTVVSGARTRIVLENDFAGFPPNDDPDGNALGAAKVTCAHEFKHASQRSSSFWSEGGWVELDATWAEDVVYDDTNDYYNYLPGGSGISSPTTPLDAGGTGSYEDCIWEIWMSESYTNQIIVDLWVWRRTHTVQAMMLSYDHILTTVGSSVAAGFPIYAAWNYATGSRAITGLGYSEAATYPTGSVLTASGYPYNNSGTLNHLAARRIHAIGFTPGEPGDLRVQFDGDNTATMGLVAMIKRNDGTGLQEIITLDGNNDADVVLSVALADIASVGIIASNSGISGDNKTYDVTLTKELPLPSATLSSASVAKTLDPDTQGTEILTLGNNGLPGSELNYQIYDMSSAPAKRALLGRDATLVGNERTVPELRQSELMTVPRYAGDCVLGNDDTANIQGYYGTWWEGNESYATRINPADYTCACNAGFNVRAIHMMMYLETTSTPQVQVHLAAAGAVCTEPGAIIESSAPSNISGIPSNGYYDIEIPVDFACTAMANEYFLIVEFLDANGPVGIVIDSSPTSCVNYNDWGLGWQELVDGYGFAGDMLIWSDVDCCGTPDPSSQVLTPNGGEILLASAATTVTWNAIEMTDVKIELSRDGGGVWETVLATTPNDGSETVTFGGPGSQDCLLRVGSTDGLVTDVSDAPFWLYEDTPWLSVAPQSGTIVQGGSDALTLSFDSTGLPVGTYNSWVVIVSNAGSSPDVVPVVLTVQNVSAVEDTPAAFALRGNVPNPFNPTTKVFFSLAEAGHAAVDVLDLQGRVVRRLFTGSLPAGERSLVWDGRDDAGRSVASGAYIARLRSAGKTATQKMILAK